MPIGIVMRLAIYFATCAALGYASGHLWGVTFTRGSDDQERYRVWRKAKVVKLKVVKEKSNV